MGNHRASRHDRGKVKLGAKEITADISMVALEQHRSSNKQGHVFVPQLPNEQIDRQDRALETVMKDHTFSTGGLDPDNRSPSVTISRTSVYAEQLSELGMTTQPQTPCYVENLMPTLGNGYNRAAMNEDMLSRQSIPHTGASYRAHQQPDRSFTSHNSHLPRFISSVHYQPGVNIGHNFASDQRLSNSDQRAPSSSNTTPTPVATGALSPQIMQGSLFLPHYHSTVSPSATRTDQYMAPATLISPSISEHRHKRHIAADPNPAQQTRLSRDRAMQTASVQQLSGSQQTYARHVRPAHEVLNHGRALSEEDAAYEDDEDHVDNDDHGNHSNKRRKTSSGQEICIEPGCTRPIPKRSNEDRCGRCMNKLAKQAAQWVPIRLEDMSFDEAREIAYTVTEPLGKAGMTEKERQEWWDDFHDNTQPDQQRIWVGQMIQALNTPYQYTWDEVQSNESTKTRTKDQHEALFKTQKVFEAKFHDQKHQYNNRKINARLRLLFETLKIMYTGGACIYDEGGDNSGYHIEHGKLCGERLDLICQMLTLDKRICMDVIEGRGVNAFVRDPLAYERRKQDNVTSNSKKARQRKEAAEATAMAPGNSKKVLHPATRDQQTSSRQARYTSSSYQSPTSTILTPIPRPLDGPSSAISSRTRSQLPTDLMFAPVAGIQSEQLMIADPPRANKRKRAIGADEMVTVKQETSEANLMYTFNDSNAGVALGNSFNTGHRSVGQQLTTGSGHVSHSEPPESALWSHVHAKSHDQNWYHGSTTTSYNQFLKAKTDFHSSPQTYGSHRSDHHEMSFDGPSSIHVPSTSSMDLMDASQSNPHPHELNGDEGLSFLIARDHIGRARTVDLAESLLYTLQTPGGPEDQHLWTEVDPSDYAFGGLPEADNHLNFDSRGHEV